MNQQIPPPPPGFELIGAGSPPPARQPAPAPARPAASASQPRGLRNNNPGNIEDGAFARSLPGYAGSDGRFARFETAEAGQQAAPRLLQSYLSRGFDTPAAIINRWAPPSDNNPTADYAAYVARRVGVGVNDKVTPDHVPLIAQAIAEFENGQTVGGPSTPQPRAPAPPPGFQIVGDAELTALPEGQGFAVRAGAGMPPEWFIANGLPLDATTEDMLAAGFVPNQETGEWEKGDPRSAGHIQALAQEREIAGGEAPSYANPSFVDQFTAPINDELAFLAGAGMQGVANFGGTLTGQENEISALDRARAMRDLSREGQEQFEQDKPIQALGGGILGGLAFAPARAAAIPGLMGRLGQAGAVSSAYGAADGDGVGGRAGSAAVAGLVGLGTAGALEGVAPAARGLLGGAERMRARRAPGEIDVYHGSPVQGLTRLEPTPQDGTFDFPAVVSVSTDPKFAGSYAGEGGTVYRGAVSAQNLGDFRRPQDVARLVDFYRRAGTPLEADDIAAAEAGAWRLWENPDLWRREGWKGSYVREEPGTPNASALNISLASGDDIVLGRSARPGGLPNRNERRVTGALERALKRDSMTPQGLAGALSNMPEGRLPFEAGGENLIGLAETMAQAPGRARTSLLEAVGARRDEASNRVAGRLSDSFGAQGNGFQALRQRVRARGEEAEAGMAPIADRPVPLDDASVQAFRSRLTSPAVRNAAEEAIAELSPEGAAAANRLFGLGDQVLDNPGAATITIREAQDISYELNQAAGRAYRGGFNSRGEALKTLANTIRGNARQAVPEYDGWLKSFGDASEGIDAMRTGQNVFARASEKNAMSAAELQERWGNWSAQARENYRLGVGEAVLDRVRGNGGVTAMRRLLRDNELADRVRIAFDSEDAFLRFMQTADDEVSMANIDNQILGGSPTARRVAGAADVNQQGMGPADAFEMMSEIGSPVAMGRRAIGLLAKNLPRRDRSILGNEELNGLIGRALTDETEMTRLLNLAQTDRDIGERVARQLRGLGLLSAPGVPASGQQRGRGLLTANP